jgi:hypothetical protein
MILKYSTIFNTIKLTKRDIGDQVLKSKKNIFESLNISQLFSILQSLVHIIKFGHDIKKSNTDLLFISSVQTRICKEKKSYNKFVFPFVKKEKKLKIINIEDGLIRNGKILNKYSEYNFFIFYIFIKLIYKLKEIFNLKRRESRYTKSLFAFIWYHKFFHLLLKRLRPKLVLTINWYGIRGRALIYTCRILDIKTIDIQHGLAASSHQRYYKYLNKINDLYLPSAFFSWTKTDRDLLNKQFQTRRAYYIGNPSLFQENSNFKFTEGINYVLLILSVDLPDWLDDFILYLNQMNISCLVKEHPVNKIKKNLPLYFYSNNLFISEKLPINSLLSTKCIGCVTEWSAGILDVLDTGIKCYSIGETGKSYFKLYSEIEKCLNLDIFKYKFESKPSNKYTPVDFDCYNAKRMINEVVNN